MVDDGTNGPPTMDPDTSEATAKQLELAKGQGDAYDTALEYMTGTVAHGGGETEAGHYSIGYAVEGAEGMYEVNGVRFTKVEEVTFTGVSIERGREVVAEEDVAAARATS